MKLFALGLFIAALAAACGGQQISEEIAEQAIGGNADVEISGEGDDLTVNIESDEGSLSIGSSAQLPDELTIPVPDGGDVTAAGTQGTSAFAALIYPKDRYDEIVAFYESWTSGTGDEWSTQTSSLDIGGGTQRSAQWASTGNGLFILVSECIDASSGSTEFTSACVTLNQN